MTLPNAHADETSGNAAAVFQMITGHYLSAAVNTAAQIKLADAMSETPLDHAVLAERTDTNPDSLFRLLCLLASAGLVTDEGDGRFSLTAAGRLLREDDEESLRPVALMHGGPGHVQRWLNLREHLVTAPKSSEQKPTGNPFAQLPPHVAEIFNGAMSYFSRHTAKAVIAAYDFGRFSSLVDIGGGRGELLAAVLRANPGLRGTLFDLPSVVEGTEATFAEAGLADHAEVLGGDFFDSVPADHDAYLLKNVLHDWDDERCGVLLRNIRAAIPAHGRVLLVETVRPDRFDTALPSRLAAYSNLSMLMAGGAERSEPEYARLLAAAGLALRTVTVVRPEWTGADTCHVIEAVRDDAA
ncbi:methyltransferase [Kitasatospora sp. NPDC089509]|uniref:methyltransferase n=1 Tax=Kitasatospora sp. NPDC089509 TaxID=3364079 RepID=UPI003823475D